MESGLDIKAHVLEIGKYVCEFYKKKNWCNPA